MNLNHTAIKLLVKQILLHPENHDWTLQGFGMLRTYLDPDHVFRLHIWSQAHAVPNVSDMHTHPWDFKSTVIGGAVTDQGFTRVPIPGALPGNINTGTPYQQQLIKCGVGGCAIGDPTIVELVKREPMTWREGDSYRLLADEIHASYPEDGTVTLVERVFREDVDHAHVFFPVGQEWVSAEPRAATPAEVEAIIGLALERWFSS